MVGKGPSYFCQMWAWLNSLCSELQLPVGSPLTLVEVVPLPLVDGESPACSLLGPLSPPPQQGNYH